MVEDGESKEDKFDFSSEGEALGYISLEQARLLAMQTARDAPGDYGRRFRDIRMVFQPVQEEEGEDYYVVTLSFRPEGDFAGNPGQEQFFIEKEGRVAHRQVLSHPSGGERRRLPVIPIGIGLVIVVIVAVVVVLVVGGGGGDDGGSAAAGPIPTATNVPASAGASQSDPEPTATPVKPTPRPAESTLSSPTPEIGPTETPRADGTTPAVVPTSTPTPTPRPTVTPLAPASATPDSDPLRMLLVRAVGEPLQLAHVSRSRTASRVEVPVVFGLPDADYSELRSRLWTTSSLVFSGDGFSGSWSGQPRAQLVLQLEGLEDADYSYCIALRKNGNEFASACGSRLSNTEFSDAVITTKTRLSAPSRIENGDVFEIAIVLGSSFRPGAKPVPSLVYGGRTDLTRSYLDITPDPTIGGKGTCPSTSAASLTGGVGSTSQGIFRLYMVSTAGNTQALAPLNTGQGQGFRLEFPEASTGDSFGAFDDLRQKLWTPLSIIFCGRGFSGTLPAQSQVQLRLQLEGIQSSRVPYCVELRRDGAMLSNSCSTSMSGLSGDGQIRTGTINLDGPGLSTQITPADVLEVSINFSTGTNSRTPILRYGGATAQTTSLIEITSGDS